MKPAEDLDERLRAIRESPTYRLAYEDIELLGQDELRPLRLQLELLKPERILHEQGIRSTVVVFGSARVSDAETAEARLGVLERQALVTPEDVGLRQELARANRRVEQARHYEQARRFSGLISARFQQQNRRDFVVVTGGGPGIMEAANRGAFEVGARSIGLNITLLHEQAPNPYMCPDLAFRFHYFALRKMHFLLHAKGLVAFPGGYGTLDELFEVLTLIQTRKMQRVPVVLVGRAFWRRVVDFDLLLDEGYGRSEQLRPIARQCLTVIGVSAMQLSFGDAEGLGSRKRTRREVFLAEMEQVVPWQALLGLIEPHYPKMGRPGRQPYPLATMLRIHFLQQWYALSDPAMEEALYDTPVMRRFAQLGGLADIPDETTILNFRRLLETHGLAEKLFEQVNAHLQRKGLSLRSGTIVDATIISAPSSTKNKAGERDPAMHQTKKGNQWFFGMKAHIGVDDASGLVHHVECTAANVADVTQVHKLLHGREDTVCGDSGYTGAEKREELQDVDAGFLIAEKPSKLRAMKNPRERRYTERWERYKASLRAKVEHPFRVIKRQFGYTKVRYRGLAKNAAQVLTLFALSNLWMARRRLLPTTGAVRP